MIIDDEHRMVFVHIPKCGGTSVKRNLGEFDSSRGGFRRKSDHPTLGTIHLSHIPLRFLKVFYFEEFEKVAAYQAFALTRDPLDRFASATFQRLMEFRGIPRMSITSEMAVKEARAVTEWLNDRDEFCDLEYIHFSRQIDYVELDGRRIVENVFALENIAGLAEAMERLVGVTFDPDFRENTNFASGNHLINILRAAKPVYSRLTSWEFREQVLLRLRQWDLLSPNSLYRDFRRDRHIAKFVEDYYSKDFDLYRTALSRKPQMGGAEAIEAGS